MSNALSSDAIRLLLSNVFYRAGNTTRRIFLNIYIFKFIGDLKVLATFSLLMLGFHFISFFCNSYIVKKGYRNMLSLISLIGSAAVFLLFAYDLNLIGSHYVLISIILGIFSGMYWCVNGNNQFDLTIPKNRGNYEGWKKTLRTINSLFTPILIGALISLGIGDTGYAPAFIFGACMFLFSAYLSAVDEKNLKTHETKLRLGKMFQNLKGNNNILGILCIIFLTGFALSTNVIEVITPLVMVGNGINELGIGIFISLISGVSIIASFVFGKYVDYKYYKYSYFFAGCMYLLLISLVLILPSQFYFTIFITSLALLYIFIDIPTVVFASNYIHELDGYEHLKSEYILMREFFTIAGRAVMFLPILFMTSFSIESLSFIFILMFFSILLSMIIFSRLSIPKTH